MSKVGAVLATLCVLAIATGIGALLGKYFPGGFGIGYDIRRMIEPPFGGKKVVRILVLGEDNTGGNKSKPQGLSDTIILASIDLETKRVAALSIPRDTRVDLDGYSGECKINAAHAFGGPNLAEMAVEGLVGIKPDYYMKTNIEGFTKLVDILGGVEIDVEKNMHYVDHWGGLHIDLKKGQQLLNGEKAMEYVRFRHDVLGDITRIQRQQKFLKALAEKALAPSNLPKLPRVIPAVLKNVQTDLSLKDVIYLAEFAGKLDLSQVDMATLPGMPETIGKASYWIADPDKTSELVQDLFFPESAVSLPKVEVLNGSGISGAAQKVAELLKQHGYEVTTVGNADSFDYSSIQVINHKADAQGVDQIASILNQAVVKNKRDSSAKADVTVIVGKDFIF